MAHNGRNPKGALVRAAHPWSDTILARLYDAFPFDADLPLYTELAREQGGPVLDVACGTGRVLVPLAQAGNQVVGIDASPHMLDVVSEKLEIAGPKAKSHTRLVQGDMRSFNLDSLFDLAIVAVKSLAYLTSREDQQRALLCIARHLRPGGLLALDLKHPRPEWLAEAPGSLRQDLVHEITEPALGGAVTVARTEAVVSTDLASQVRVIRSAYEIVKADGSVSKRFVEWPYRYVYRFEAELLLESTGYEVESVFGGYSREPLTSESDTMLFLARRK